jgi:hypothetical protein
MKKIQTPIRRSIGNQLMNSTSQVWGGVSSAAITIVGNKRRKQKDGGKIVPRQGLVIELLLLSVGLQNAAKR